MAWLPFVIEILLILVVVVILLNKYTTIKKKTFPYYLGIYLGWFLALYVIILMPIDISMVCSLSEIPFLVILFNCPLGMV